MSTALDLIKLAKHIAKGEVPEFVCVLHPVNGKPSGLFATELPYDILEGVKFLGMTKAKTFQSAELKIGIELEQRKARYLKIDNNDISNPTDLQCPV